MMSGPSDFGPRNGDPAPACLSCRQRKLRCSRELPACEQCIRLGKECLYDHRRQKPGLKAGTIEAIHRRLNYLEGKVAENERDCKHARGSVERIHSGNASSKNILPKEPRSVLATPSIDSPQRTGTRDVLIAGSPSSSIPDGKRRKISPESYNNVGLPSQTIVDAAISQYFRTTHHWIPMVHEGRLREKLRESENLDTYAVVLHAMVASYFRHVASHQLGLSAEAIRAARETATAAVITHGISHMTMQSAQALIILTFDKLGQGDWPIAWSLLGTLTRMLDYLGLTNDENPSTQQQLLRPLQLLTSPADVAESEERRRVFWNVLLLDRLCSVTCGWPTAITSDKVRRRLPCNGALWRNRQPSTTPYFGVWDKTQAKLGHPVAHLPSHRASSVHEDGTTPSDSDAMQRIDISHLGAVSYRIEATESLSQISCFFLHQSVDLRNPNDMRDWLTRFTELDLRLVQWKMFLPQKWRQASVSRMASAHMDPNLTLAHVIHNTSTVLLHQQIAYPPVALKQAINLPSTSSAKTCQMAAVEISSIIAKYLAFAKDMFVNTEFVFCAFVAGIALLAQSTYYGNELSTHFDTLIGLLDEISARWNGLDNATSNDESSTTFRDDIAALGATRLRQFRAHAQNHAQLFADVLLQSSAEALLYPNFETGSNTGQPALDSLRFANRFSASSPRDHSTLHDSSSMNRSQNSSQSFMNSGITQLPPMSVNGADPRSAMGGDGFQLPTSLPLPPPQPPFYTNSLSSMSYIGDPAYGQDYSLLPNLVMRDDFANVDRVITSDGTNFDFNSFLPDVQPSY